MTEVHLFLSVEKAERLTSALADFTCWLSGFRAARPDVDLNDLDVNGLRLLLGELKDARSRAVPAAPPPDDKPIEF